MDASTKIYSIEPLVANKESMRLRVPAQLYIATVSSIFKGSKSLFTKPSVFQFQKKKRLNQFCLCMYQVITAGQPFLISVKL